MARATGDGGEDRDSSRKTNQRPNPPRTRQDNQGKDNQGKGPLVKNKDHGRNDETQREPNKRRDPDGFCAGGAKVVIDALKTAGVLDNDGWRHIVGLRHTWSVDATRPGVLVTITES